MSAAPVVVEKPKHRRAPKEAAELAETKKENKALRDANKQLQVWMQCKITSKTLIID